MPNGRHLFRGIHDPETVRQGVTISIRKSSKKAILTLRSSSIGHYLPTYIVPRIRLTGLLLNSQGVGIAASLRNKTLQRVVQYTNTCWQEVRDTRLPPGESISLSVPWRIGKQKGKQIHFKIEVDPDNYYLNQVYRPILNQEEGKKNRLIRKAAEEARANRYILYEKIVDQ